MVWRCFEQRKNKSKLLKSKVGEESAIRLKREARTESAQAPRNEGKSDPKPSKSREIICFKCQG